MNKFKNSSKPFMWVMGFLMAVFVAGCGSDGGGNAQPGVLGVSLTDNPACGFDEVNVTVSKVRVHQSGNASENAAGWTDITLNPARKINLLNLNDPTQPNFALESLGETSLEAGHYTQLRLVLVPNSPSQPLNNSVVLSEEPPSLTEIPLETPSGIRSGIKLIHQFTVNSGQRVDLLLDFDACHSIVKTGNSTYKLKPVIKVIPYALNGIQGFVDKNSFVNQSLVGKNVIASAQFSGEIVRATVVNTDTGKFFLAHLNPANDYDVVITADDHATAVIARVPVDDAPSITTVSTEAAPIPLNSSGNHSVDGTVTLSPLSATDETVFVAAKQTFGSVPPLTVVTVKSQVAVSEVDLQNNPTGNYPYALTLPIAAPSFGQYSTPPPPITLTAQSGVAGKYTVEASADGYVPKSSSVDISLADSTQNFTLNP